MGRSRLDGVHRAAARSGLEGPTPLFNTDPAGPTFYRYNGTGSDNTVVLRHCPMMGTNPGPCASRKVASGRWRRGELAEVGSIHVVNLSPRAQEGEGGEVER